nr:cation-dependent mannose-6-phosphate receptor isoform X1 [Biomphalaria glabrata]
MMAELGVLLCVLMSLVQIQAVEVCVKVGPCSCTYADKHIDLSPLVQNPGPRFKDMYDQYYNNRFSYNPCIAFTESTCANMAVCQQNLQGQFFPCGSQESAVFVSSDVGVTLQYSYHDGALTRTSNVELVCATDDTVSLEILGENPSLFYSFKLHSKACCPQDGALSAIVTGISVGTVLVIIFFSALVLYLLVGVSFQKFARKASGKEVIPNYTFWSGFPGLVKEGACFVVTRGKGRSGYDKV